MPEPVADLYQLEPSQFTAARNALAKQMKADGRGDEAVRVGKLRRPPVTAWALNQVARHEPDLVGQVLETGGRLRSAMQQAVDGDASGLRDAQAAQRRAVDAAVAAAAARLSAAGHPDNEAARQRMAATVGAAVVDEAVAEELRSGLLDGDRSAPGFGLDALTPGSAPSVPKPAQSSVKPVAPRKAEAPERERRREARARHAELTAEATRLAHKAERLATRAEEAERQAAAARSAADEARAEADEARRQADAANIDASPG